MGTKAKYLLKKHPLVEAEDLEKSTKPETIHKIRSNFPTSRSLFSSAARSNSKF